MNHDYTPSPEVVAESVRLGFPADWPKMDEIEQRAWLRENGDAENEAHMDAWSSLQELRFNTQ